MKLFPLFFFMAALTVLTPGPGVLMTLTNSLRYGKKETFGGILGISFGAMLVAAISATGLGVVLAASVLAFTTLKVIGALYLVYLGVRLWRAPAFRFDQQPPHEAGVSRRFVEGGADNGNEGTLFNGEADVTQGLKCFVVVCL